MRTKAELDFIQEYTRQLLVEWAHQQVNGKVPAILDEQEPYAEFAISKKWLSSDKSRILATGFNTAAAFLRR